MTHGSNAQLRVKDAISSDQTEDKSPKRRTVYLQSNLNARTS